jgi:hypothetical protein
MLWAGEGVGHAALKKPNGNALTVGKVLQPDLLQYASGGRTRDRWGQTVSDSQRGLTPDHQGHFRCGMEIVCRLHILHVSCHHPLPTLDLLSWADNT